MKKCQNENFLLTLAHFEMGSWWSLLTTWHCVPLWHCDIVLYSSALWHCFPLSKLSKSESVACRGSSWDVLMSLKYRLLPIKRTRSISLSDDRQTAFVWTFLDINWQLQLLLCHKWMLFFKNRFCWKANKRFPIFVQFICFCRSSLRHITNWPSPISLGFHITKALLCVSLHGSFPFSSFVQHCIYFRCTFVCCIFLCWVTLIVKMWSRVPVVTLCMALWIAMGLQAQWKFQNIPLIQSGSLRL